MSRKKNTPKTLATPAADLPALKIGSRVRCTDDQVEGRIVWANAVSVKVQWDDGEQVTWRRDSLAGRPVEILDADGQGQPPTAVIATERGGALERSAPETTPPAPEPTVIGPADPAAQPAAAKAAAPAGREAPPVGASCRWTPNGSNPSARP